MKKLLGVLCVVLVFAMAVPSSATARWRNSFPPAAAVGEVIEISGVTVKSAPCGHYAVCGIRLCCACGRYRGEPACLVCCN